MIIIVFFLAGFALFGVWQSRRNRSVGDYFLGGRTLPWPAAMFSIVATETSVLTFISIPGLAYRGDWFFLQLALGYIAGRVVVSVFLLPLYFKHRVTSIYEVIGKRFGPGVQKCASIIFLVTRVLADGVRFLATAVIVQVVTGWSLSNSVLVIGIVTLIYSISGGIRSIILVDSIQFFIYLLGAVLSIGFLCAQIDLSAFEAVERLYTLGKFKIFQFEDPSVSNAYFAVTAVAGGLLFSLASHGADYMMVQRVLACRDLKAARKAMVGSGVFAFLQFSVFLFVGSLLFLRFDGASLDKDREFTTFIVEELPFGVKGILLAGVLSAAMSTLSSSINSLASSTLMDLVKKKTTGLALSRIVTCAWAFVLMAIALLFDESDSAVVVLGLKIASFTYGGLLALFILSRLKRRFSAESIIAGLASGIALLLYLNYKEWAWTLFVPIGVSVNLLVTWFIELMISPVPDDQ